MKLPVLEHIHCEYCKSRFKSVFCDLNVEDLENLSLHKTCNIYPKGQIIFWEGNNPQSIFCINEGVVKTSKIGVDGREQILRMAKQGDILGYRSMLTGEPSTVSAVALEDTKVCQIPKENFLKLVQTNSDVSMKLMKLLASELDAAEITIASLAQKQVRERVAETLLMLKEFYGMEDDGKTIKASMSRYDIASIAGTARETATRLLSEFKHDKVIDFDTKRILILNPQKLISIANISD
ncbi:MAG: Crp/Fnr family transcriptional regulator [Ignavibacteriae bacterium]|nr:Crp/Fnr family transcriptional regulator [Ignavibacteriota bacterium]MCB9244241.1 Crp/Fnr family transcriptional regulator [Ignavibacteriales bacterium]